MAIHPSSLSSAPVRSNQRPVKNTAAQNNESSAAKDAANQKPNPPSSTEKIKKTLANVDLQSQSNIIKPTDSKTQRALSAYRQEFNAPHQAKLAQSLTGIDAYA